MGSSPAEGMFVVVSLRLHRVHPSPLLLLPSLLSPLSGVLPDMPSIISDVLLSHPSSFVFVLVVTALVCHHYSFSLLVFPARCRLCRRRVCGSGPSLAPVSALLFCHPGRLSSLMLTRLVCQGDRQEYTLVDSLQLDLIWLLGRPLSVDWTEDRHAQYNLESDKSNTCQKYYNVAAILKSIVCGWRWASLVGVVQRGHTPGCDRANTSAHAQRSQRCSCSTDCMI